MIDITNEKQMAHFCRCWGVTKEDIILAIQLKGTDKIEVIYEHLNGPSPRMKSGFYF